MRKRFSSLPVLALIFALFYIGGRVDIYLIALLCAGLHELGHVAGMLVLGYCPGNAQLEAGGVRMSIGGGRLPGYGADLVICLAGPMMSFVLFLLGTGLMKLGYWPFYMPYFAGINLVLCLFNLMPVRCLDGGRALMALLCLKGSYTSALDKSGLISRAAVALLFLAGIAVFLLSGFNISLLVAAMILAVKERNGSF